MPLRPKVFIVTASVGEGSLSISPDWAGIPCTQIYKQDANSGGFVEAFAFGSLVRSTQTIEADMNHSYLFIAHETFGLMEAIGLSSRNLALAIDDAAGKSLFHSSGGNLNFPVFETKHLRKA